MTYLESLTILYDGLLYSTEFSQQYIINMVDSQLCVNHYNVSHAYMCSSSMQYFSYNSFCQVTTTIDYLILASRNIWY